MFEPGTVIAGYRVERLLGSGGMGAVFLARHPELPRYDALKVLKDSAGLTDNNFRRRFLREAEVAATLDHPNIVTVFNRGRATVPVASKSGQSDLLWIAMQYVPGTDCARELHDIGRFAPPRVAHIVSQVARGIDHANRRGLTHRDVKPGNILLAEVDEDSPVDEQRVLLTDFGVAKISDETEALTSVGTVLATLSYASPEQLMGRTLDGRSDQYSLAASTFHLLTGRVPFDDRDTGAVIGAHLKEPVPPASELVPGLPSGVDGVISRAMAKTPEERFANCREFAEALTASVRPVKPPAVPDAGAVTVRGPSPRPVLRNHPASTPAARRPGPPTSPPPGRPVYRGPSPTPPGGEATRRAAPRQTPGRPVPDRARQERQAPSRPATGADPAVWQHPPSGPHRQTNDHLRAAGSGPMGRPPSGPPFPGGTVSSGGPTRSGSNRLPLVLAGVAAVLLILIVLVFVVAL
ncbi:protein kinase [Gordonia rubripertincta]|uniref:non-specific serine/threonine protein kinase n=2 Tax=Gordonia rubripertincta TaxID=36822 RepID=A0AAW6R6B0_GORRU|nr:serine/threonine-protein kinase [Gordonia rubripertincta]MDG6779700.1 protein kinase [Gordonia rubripertincta]NKY63688.1 protein kinase [Gordonia rubripertincta]GAB85971.1 putative serine/threonine protein kinase [Gordonia rubripertincta NBRC 101908]